MKKNTFIVSVIANILEYYDFFIYVVFAIQIGRSFFSGLTPTAQILSAFAVFAVGAFTRPFGGVMFGHLGDTYGRKFAMFLSMLGMGGATLVISLIPDYDKIGIYAPILLIIFRIVQGLCLSGGGSAVAVFLLEHYQNNRPGLIGSISMSSNIVGMLLAVCIGTLVNSSKTLDWRDAFAFGSILMLVGVYFRLKISESPEFNALKEKGDILKNPLIELLKTDFRRMLLAATISGVSASFTVFINAYLNIILIDVLKIDQSISLIYVSICVVLLIIFMPFFGWLSDKYNPKKIMIYAALTSIVMVVPALMLLKQGSHLAIIISLMIIALLAAAISAPTYVFTINLFPVQERFSGALVCENFGSACLGGISPIIFTMLVKVTKLDYSAGLYLMFTSALLVLVMKVFSNTTTNQVNQDLDKQA